MHILFLKKMLKFTLILIFINLRLSCCLITKFLNATYDKQYKFEINDSVEYILEYDQPNVSILYICFSIFKELTVWLISYERFFS